MFLSEHDSTPSQLLLSITSVEGSMLHLRRIKGRAEMVFQEYTTFINNRSAEEMYNETLYKLLYQKSLQFSTVHRPLQVK